MPAGKAKKSRIGSWGKSLVFEVYEKKGKAKVLTFQDFKRETTTRWTDHGIIGKKPRSEYKGPGLDSVSMTVKLSAQRGVKPRAVINRLVKAQRTGHVAYLYVGGKKVGQNRMRLETISQSWDEVWNKGELVSATLELSFSEYATGTKKKTDSVSAVETTQEAASGSGSSGTSAKKKKSKEYKKGDTATFAGGDVYEASTSKKSSGKRAQGPVTVLAYLEGKPHPYCVRTSDWSKTTVYGWVDKGTVS